MWPVFNVTFAMWTTVESKVRSTIYNVDEFASKTDVRRVMLTNQANVGEDGFASNGYFGNEPLSQLQLAGVLLMSHARFTSSNFLALLSSYRLNS